MASLTVPRWTPAEYENTCLCYMNEINNHLKIEFDNPDYGKDLKKYYDYILGASEEVEVTDFVPVTSQEIQGVFENFYRRPSVGGHSSSYNQPRANESNDSNRLKRKVDDEEELLFLKKSSLSSSYTDVENDKLPKLHEFAWAGDLIRLEKYLSSSVKRRLINQRDYDGRTALHFAASWGDVRMAKLLISACINVNLKDYDGKTSLRKAVEFNSFECVQLLLESGADQMLKAQDDLSPLDYALKYLGDDGYKIISYLYENSKDQKDDQHLHKLLSCDRAASKITKRLILQGASVDGLDQNGRTPIMCAVQLGLFDIANALVQHNADIFIADNYGQTALNYAVHDEACLTLLQETVANKIDIFHTKSRPNVGGHSSSYNQPRANDSSTSLVNVPRKGGVESVTEDSNGLKRKREDEEEQPVLKKSSLSSSYSDSNVENSKLPTLHKFAWAGDVIRLEKYLSSSVNCKHINQRDYDGRTALHFAASWGDVRMAKLLVSACINVNAKDYDGKTSLRKAVEFNSFECVQLLLERGADQMLKAHDNLSPLDYALKYLGDDGYEIISYLYENLKDQKDDQHLHKLLSCNRAVSEIAERLILQGASVDGLDQNGRTPIMCAVQLGLFDIANALVQHNADIFIADNYGQTALNYAVHDEACLTLLQETVANKIDTFYTKSSAVKKKNQF